MIRTVPADDPLSDKVEVRIDHKTVIYVKKGVDVDEAVARYKAHIKDPHAHAKKIAEVRRTGGFMMKSGKKHCNRCFKEKKASEFIKQASYADGYMGTCKICAKRQREGNKKEEEFNVLENEEFIARNTSKEEKVIIGSPNTEPSPAPKVETKLPIVHCKTCGDDKPKIEFYPQNINQNKTEGKCKKCVLLYQKKRKEERFQGFKDRDSKVEVEEEITKHNKKCSKCLEIKSTKEFHKSKRSPDGFTYACKDCNSKYHKERNKGKSKKCGKCGKTKPVLSFNAHNSNEDGLQYYCKVCRRKADRDSYNRNHREEERNIGLPENMNKVLIQELQIRRTQVKKELDAIDYLLNHYES